MRFLLTRFLASAIGAYVVFSLIGLAVSPGGETTPVDSADAAASLAFAFPDASGNWTEATGRVSHGWLLRRATIEGDLVAESRLRHSEQILKVGWPFTVVRGFVRTTGAELQTEGARIIGASTTPARILPLQPVWPGILLMGLVGTLLLTLGAQVLGHRDQTVASAS